MEEYIKNAKEYNSLDLRASPEDRTLEQFTQRLHAQRRRRRQLVQRNMELLREELLPALDNLTDADERQALQDFSVRLLDGRQTDAGLVCQIQETLLALARQEGNLPALIEHLYWLGLGRFALAKMLVNMDEAAARYFAGVRKCFQEAASYLDHFEEFADDKTRGYIIRATANRALGQFATVGERTRRLKEALGVMEDPYYRALAPDLPWEEYIKQTHRLMVGSIAHSKERAMTGRDVADIMRSVYIVYRDREPSPEQTFHRSAIEFYCGIHGVDNFLQQLERQIDAADSRDFSREGMYALVSLSAYYCHYLSQYPEQMGERERFYIAGLYRRVQSYLDALPPGREDEDLFSYLRQFIGTFIETEQGIPYRDFLLRLICRLAPELYIHGCIVGRMAKVLCGFLLDQEETFFDGIPFIRDISDPAEKRKAVLEYAEGCGLFHDAGKINCPEIHARIARLWFPVEDEMARLHPIAGHELLAGRASTKRYAIVALGHHVWYDGNTAQSYPAAYRRSQCPEHRMVDAVAIVDWIAYGLDEYWPGPESRPLYDKTVKQAIALGGKQFSPRTAVLLKEEAVQAALWRAMEDGASQASRGIYGQTT